MNYGKIYESLTARAVGRKKLRKGSEGYVYYEKLHIIPRCMGGIDSPENLSFLTPEEHWLAHLLLVKMYPGNEKLVFACQAMSRAGGHNQRVNNKLFGWIRKKYSEEMSKRQSGRTVSDSTKKLISDSLKGREALHQKGVNNVMHRPEVVAKRLASMIDYKHGPHSEDTKRKISEANKGHKGLTGDRNPSSWRVCCIVCHKETAIPSLGRYHKKCSKAVDK